MVNLTLEQIKEINEQILSLCEQLHSFQNAVGYEDEEFEEHIFEIDNLKEALRRFSNDEWNN